MTEAIVQTSELFEKYIPSILALPHRECLKKSDLLVPAFRLYHYNRLDVYYAPFDYVNEAAKVMVLGIIPGWTQMEIANRHARQYLLDSLSMSEARPLREEAGRLSQVDA